MRRLSGLGSLLWLCAAHASADAIGPAPACPPGARGAYAHEGEWCVPAPCADDSGCEGSACREWRVCTRFSSVVPGGLRARPAPAERRELVVATCDPAAACTGTDEPPPSVVGTFEPGDPSCTTARYCVPEALPELPPRGAAVEPPPSETPSESPSAPASAPASPGGTCGCGTAGRASTASLMLGALVLVTLGWRRR